MVSVERILQYGKLTPEAAEHTDNILPPNWPKEGIILFDNVSLSYDTEYEPALKDVSFMINSKEKVTALIDISILFYMYKQ